MFWFLSWTERKFCAIAEKSCAIANCRVFLCVLSEAMTHSPASQTPNANLLTAMKDNTANAPTNVTPIATVPMHERLTKMISDALSRKGRVEKSRRDAYLKANPDAQGNVTSTRKQTKEGFTYPALASESKEDHFALSFIAALERLDKMSDCPVMASLASAFADGERAANERAEKVSTSLKKAKTA